MDMNQKKRMRLTKKGVPLISKSAIFQALFNDTEYKDEDILIRKWEKDSNKDYLASISTNGMRYIGIVNQDFERNKHGFLSYANGEQYLGCFKDNLRHKKGVYFWEPILINDIASETDMYIGSWENDEMKGEGLYLCLKEGKTFESSDMEVYNGIINQNKITRGTHLLKRELKYYVYHGNFDSEGNKNDENAYYYDSDSEMLIKGKIVNNYFINGFIGLFNFEEQLTDLAYCTFNENKNTIKTVTDQSNLNFSSIDRVKKDLELFRSVIMQTNYFGNIYTKYQTTKEFIKNNMKSIDIFDDTEKFLHLIDTYTDYRSSNIFGDIEKNVFLKEY